MSITDVHAEHTLDEHQHGEGCGHEAIQHDEHIDYHHDTHRRRAARGRLR